MMWYGGPWIWEGRWFGTGIIGSIFGLITMLIVFAGIFYAFRWIFPRHYGNNRGGYYYEDESFEILKRRYANGEITKEEYERIKKDLGFK